MSEITANDLREWLERCKAEDADVVILPKRELERRARWLDKHDFEMDFKCTRYGPFYRELEEDEAERCGVEIMEFQVYPDFSISWDGSQFGYRWEARDWQFLECMELGETYRVEAGLEPRYIPGYLKKFRARLERNARRRKAAP